MIKKGIDISKLFRLQNLLSLISNITKFIYILFDHFNFNMFDHYVVQSYYTDIPLNKFYVKP